MLHFSASEVTLRMPNDQQVKKTSGAAAVVTNVQPAPTDVHGGIKGFIGGFLLALVLIAAAGGGYYFRNEITENISNLQKRPYSEAQALALIREKIMPSVVLIRCADEDGGEEAWAGSGIFVMASGTPYVETNAHVVLGSDGLYHGCNVYFPRANTGAIYDSVYAAGEPMLYDKVQSYIETTKVEGVDYAVLPLTGPVDDGSGVQYPFPPTQPDMALAMGGLCKSLNAEIKIGDKLFVLGYPATGGDSLTFTEGIVSGFMGDFGEMIKVSAATNHGNSGGLAVTAGDICQIGIPSRATFAAGSNLGIILSSSFLSMFIDNMTGKYTYTPPSKDTPSSEYLTKKFDLTDFSISYPDEWTPSSYDIGPNNVQHMTIDSPSEGALDDVREKVTIYSFPDSTNDDLAEYLNQSAASAAQIDPGFKEFSGIVEVDGIEAYMIGVLDKTQSIPVHSSRIAFLYKGTLYVVGFDDQVGPNINNYEHMFSSMIDSIDLH